MMKRFFLFLTGIIYLTASALAQDVEVKKFEQLVKDQTAVTSPRKDINGNACGLVKVALKEAGAEFEGSVMGDVEFTGNEYLVYMPNGSKRLGIKHPDFLPTTIVFADYGTKRISSSTTYELKVKTNKKKAKVDNSKKGMAVFNIKPSNAMLLIDGQIADGSGGAYTLSLPYGTHYYTVKIKDFSLNNQTVQIDKNAKNINVDLTEFFAKVDVSCLTEDAEISVNGEQKGVGKWSGLVAPGRCMIQANKEGFHSLTKTIDLLDEETMSVNFEKMLPITGILRVENQLKDCDVYIDGKKVGKTPWVDKEMPIGEYQLKVMHEYYKPYQTTLVVNEDQELCVNENLEPTKFGRLLILAENGNPLAQRMLADLYRYGSDYIIGTDEYNSWVDDCIEDNTWRMSKEDLQEENVNIKRNADRELLWAKRVVESKNDYCTRSWLNSESYHLMECFLTGTGVKQDFILSLYWAKIAAEDNWWQANAWVAWHYFYGRGVRKDINVALSWLKKENSKYNSINGEILKSAITNNQEQWMDKSIVELLRKD